VLSAQLFQVTFVSDLAAFEKYFLEDGPALSSHTLFPEGANAEFVEVTETRLSLSLVR
jgi:hypothetical protein